jgi:DNA-binding beta-propeller fold protein YncE
MRTGVCCALVTALLVSTMPAMGETVVEVWSSLRIPMAVSVSAADGSCWVADWGHVAHLSPDGEELWQGGEWCTSVSANPTDGSCWLVQGGELVHLSASGVELWRGLELVFDVSANPTDGSCWASGPAGTVHVSESGAELWRGEPLGPLSVNASDGSCWAIAGTQIVHLAADGEQLWRGGAFVKPRSVSANPTDGSCWVAELGEGDPSAGYVNGAVVHLAASGVELWRGEGSEAPISVSVDPTDGSCWVARPGSGDAWGGSVVHLAASGSRLCVAGGMDRPYSVSVNPADGSCWVADSGGNQVVHLAATGAELWRGGGVKNATSVSVSPADGSCWVADSHHDLYGSVLHLAANGSQLWRGGEFVAPESVSADTSDGSCWVADPGNLLLDISGSGVVHLAGTGEEVWRGEWLTWASSVSAHPDDGSCWAATRRHSYYGGCADSSVVHLAAEGDQLWLGAGLSGPVATDRGDGSCWATDCWNGQVIHLSASGSELCRVGGLPDVSSISVNASDGSCWVIGGGDLVHLSGSGAELWRGTGFQGDVSVNPTDGCCWVAEDNGVVHLSADGTELGRSSPALGSAASVAVSPIDGSCWVAAGDQVVHLVVQGSSGEAGTELGSPYPSEDEWATYHEYRGQMHAHYMPDSEYAGKAIGTTGLLEKYHGRQDSTGRGYSFMAITEHHDKISYDDVFNVDPPTGMVALVGSLEDTAGLGYGHALAVDLAMPSDAWGDFCELLGAAVWTPRLNNIAQYGGVPFVAHPDSLFYPWPKAFLGSPCQGFELYSTGTANFAYWSTLAATGNVLLALEERHRQGFADDTWDDLLKSGTRGVWGIAGDDFHPDVMSDQNFDTTSVVVWTDDPWEAGPSEGHIREALEAGRFYACKGGTRAPRILAYWAEPAEHDGQTVPRVTVKLPAQYEVKFVTGKWHLWGTSPTPELQPDGTYLASYACDPDDRYVRAEVEDDSGNISWLQPIWIDQFQTTTVTVPPLGTAAATKAAVTAVQMEGAELALSAPQSALTEVTGTLLNGEERPPAPPMGYLSRCYSFTPEVALDGTNSLTVSYYPGSVRGFPASDLAIYQWDEVDTTWLPLACDVDTPSGTVTATVESLGTFAVSAEPPDDIGAPTVAIVAPGAGTEVTVLAEVVADASDDQGVATIRFYVDGWPLGTDSWGGDGWTAALDPAHYATGPKTIAAVAEGGVGNEARAETQVAVTGGMPLPVVSFSSPAPNEVLWGDLSAAGDWAGELPMALGIFTLDDEPLTAIPPPEGPWQVPIAIMPAQVGEWTLRVTGFDRYGNRAEAAVNVTLKAFTDIPLDHWARSQIYAAARAGVVQGYWDNTYRPELAVTRDQMAVYIARALAGGDAAVPSGPGEPTFGDVATDHWAYRYVEYCSGHDVVQGYPDGSYHPDEVVSRGQMAVYVARAVATPTGDAGVPDLLPEAEPTFTDVPGADSTWEWCWKYVEYCAANGSCKDTGTVPTGPPTR